MGSLWVSDKNDILRTFEITPVWCWFISDVFECKSSMDIVIIKDVDDSVVLESANNFEAQIQQR